MYLFLFFISKKHILFFKRMWSIAQDSHIRYRTSSITILEYVEYKDMYW
jgi:hypothetical protein